MILGDFSELALAIRVVNCPSYDDLVKSLPLFDTLPNDDEVEEFRSQDWTLKGQEILWASTFFHELIHLLQTTTRSALIHRHLAYHWMAAAAWEVLRECRSQGLWPPALPARDWLRATAPGLSRRLEVALGLHDLATAVKSGEPSAIDDLRSGDTGPPPWEVQALPTLGDFESDLPVELKSCVVSPRLILESEATALQARFLTYWFGRTGLEVLELVSGGFRRTDYDALSLIAAKHGMAALFPLLADWAYQMPTQMPLKQRFVTPAERLLLLYQAARPLYGGLGVWETLSRRGEIVKELSRATGLTDLDTAEKDAMPFVEELAPLPWRRVFEINLAYRAKRPQAFLAPECFYQVLFRQCCVPQLIVTGDAETNWHHDGHLTPNQRAGAMFGAIATNDVLNVVYADHVSCPFCVHHSNVGAVPISDPTTGSSCQCGWAVGFKKHWGVHPGTLKALHPEASTLRRE